LRKPGGSEEFAGTAFFLVRRILNEYHIQYAVTASHVIEGIRAEGCEKVLLRMNFLDGPARWVETEIEDWRFHPDDKSVDVAACRVRLRKSENVDHETFPVESVATHNIIHFEGIGPGDEVFIVGLFYLHAGKEKNIPIVRAGIIAAMPEEKIETPFGIIDGYLIEARSIHGLSGSPVFVYLGAFRPVDPGYQMEYPPMPTIRPTFHEGLKSPMYYLLGMMLGHFDTEPSDLEMEQINMGIGVVVPIEKVLEVINQPHFAEMERALEEEARQEMS
jgi:hypothetical protein